jgi:hypothetical protein
MMILIPKIFRMNAKEKMFLAFICYHFHLLLALARQKICNTCEYRHDALRCAFPSLHKIKHMPYNNKYCNFMLNWNILNFDGLNRYAHREKDRCQRTGKCLAICVFSPAGAGPMLVLHSQHVYEEVTYT